jgi:hypothetical protein
MLDGSDGQRSVVDVVNKSGEMLKGRNVTVYDRSLGGSAVNADMIVVKLLCISTTLTQARSMIGM